MLPDDLTDAEQRLVEEAEGGRLHDPPGGTRRNGTVRAAVLQHVLSECDLHGGVTLRRRTIDGALDLQTLTLSGPLRLLGCHLDSLSARDLRAPLLELARSKMSGTISLIDAQVDGAVRLNRMKIAGHADFRGARVGGVLDMTGSTLGADADRRSLRGDRLRVGGSVFFRSGTSGAADAPFTTSGSVWLTGAQIGGVLSFRRAHLGSDARGRSIVADRLSLAGSLYLRTIRSGSVELTGAKIGGTLTARGATLGRNNERRSLIGDRMSAGSIYLRDGFSTSGTVRLAGAVVDGIVSLRGAHLGDDAGTGAGGRGAIEQTDKLGRSLIADRLRADAVYLTDDFIATGEVGFANARITGPITVKPSNELRRLDLRSCRCGTYEHVESSWPIAGLLIDGFTYHRMLGHPGGDDKPNAADDASDKTNGDDHDGNDDDHDSNDHDGNDGTDSNDDREPAAGNVLDAKHLVAWLALQPDDEWSAGAYEELARYYDRTGDQRGARLIRRVRQEQYVDRTAASRSRTAGGLTKLAYLPSKLLVGHGYRQWPAVAALGVLMLLAWGVFFLADRDDAMVPTSSNAVVENVPQPCGENYSCFQPFVYGADVVLPIIDFGQEGEWRPDSTAPFGRWFESFQWIAIALGWALATIFVASFTGVIRRG